MVKDKITDLLKLTRKTQVEVAPIYSMSKTGFNNKIRMGETRFNLKDLILLADATNTTLAFNDSNGNPTVEFNIDDLPETS